VTIRARYIKIKKIRPDKKWTDYHFDSWGFWKHIYKNIAQKK